MEFKVDRHTDLINWIASAFDIKFLGCLNTIYNYDDYRPEPEVIIKSGQIKTPDIIAVNYKKRIALVIECKGGPNKEIRRNLGVKVDAKKIKTQINDYATIQHNSFEKYFPGFKPSEIDIVLATYPDLLSDLASLQSDMDVEKRAWWLVHLNNKVILKKYGIHTDIDLNEILAPSQGVPLPLNYPSIINFSRDSKNDHIAAEGLIRLLMYAVSNSHFEFTIDEIDDILTKNRSTNMMPLLWQMNKDERINKWRYMVDTAIKNKWMKQTHLDHYHFLVTYAAKEMDENITKDTLGKMIRMIKDTCGLHGK